MNDFDTLYNQLFGPIPTSRTNGSARDGQSALNQQLTESQALTTAAVTQLAEDVYKFVQAATAAIMSLDTRIKALEAAQGAPAAGVVVSEDDAEPRDGTYIVLPTPDLPEEWDAQSVAAFETTFHTFVDDLASSEAISPAQIATLRDLISGAQEVDHRVVSEAIHTSGADVNLPNMLLSWSDGKNLQQAVRVYCDDVYKVALIYVAFVLDMVAPEIFIDVVLKSLFEDATKG